METGKKESGNQSTRPAENPDKDKLRENPHNDEKIIYQKIPEPGSNPDLRSGSTFAEKDEEMNRVVNDEEQQQVVNPGVSDLEGKRDATTGNPYESTERIKNTGDNKPEL